VGVAGEVAEVAAEAEVAVEVAGVGTEAVEARHGLCPRASPSAPGLALPEGQVPGDRF
jgi:hypothetical protein